MRIAARLLAFTLALAPLAALGRTVCLVPLGTYNADLLMVAAEGVRMRYGLDVRIIGERPMPPTAWYEPRKRYRAERILTYLDSVEATGGCDRVVGFTGLDISTTKGRAFDFGIFGLAELFGRSAVVSTFRLTRGSPEKARERIVKVTNHELGHVLGLGHCPVRGCLMEDARGTVKTVDRSSGTLCRSCRERLRQLHDLVLPK